MRGPAPKGIETRFTEVAEVAAGAEVAEVAAWAGPPSPSQRWGRKAVACGRCCSCSASWRIRPITTEPFGNSTPATTVSRSACSGISGATGLSRMVSWAQASTYSSCSIWASVGVVVSPQTRRTSAVASASASGLRHSSQTIQAMVLAVVSSPASSMVITLPATCRSSMPLPGSSAFTSMASSRLRGCSRSVGSACRRARAWATKPSTAAFTATMLCSSWRSDFDLNQRQTGNGDTRRRDSVGKILSRCCWITSWSDSSVLTSTPKASPAMVSTV